MRTKEQGKIYYKENREMFLLAQKKYYEENKEKVLLREKIYTETYPERAKEKRRKSYFKNKIKYHCKKYGITIEQYNAFAIGGCNICGTTDIIAGKELHIDHDHVTNRVRGLLCHFCNAALGMFKDNTSLLQKAINYLNRSNSNG